MNWYCDIASGHPYHGPYHDKEYGFPLKDDALLFERLCLEVFQAGLSWLIILKKRPGLNKAFLSFNPALIANFTEEDVERLMQDGEIIRNRRKIMATIENAKRVLILQAEYGSFHAWIEKQDCADKALWLKLFKSTFVFMGGEVVGEFLMSIGKLPGAHRDDCPIMAEIRRL